MRVNIDDLTVSILLECFVFEKYLQEYCGVPASDDYSELISSAVVLYHKFLMNDAKKYGFESVKEDK